MEVTEEQRQAKSELFNAAFWRQMEQQGEAKTAGTMQGERSLEQALKKALKTGLPPDFALDTIRKIRQSVRVTRMTGL